MLSRRLFKFIKFNQCLSHQQQNTIKNNTHNMSSNNNDISSPRGARNSPPNSFSNNNNAFSSSSSNTNSVVNNLKGTTCSERLYRVLSLIEFDESEGTTFVWSDVSGVEVDIRATTHVTQNYFRAPSSSANNFNRDGTSSPNSTTNSQININAGASGSSSNTNNSNSSSAIPSSNFYLPQNYRAHQHTTSTASSGSLLGSTFNNVNSNSCPSYQVENARPLPRENLFSNELEAACRKIAASFVQCDVNSEPAQSLLPQAQAQLDQLANQNNNKRQQSISYPETPMTSFTTATAGNQNVVNAGISQQTVSSSINNNNNNNNTHSSQQSNLSSPGDYQSYNTNHTSASNNNNNQHGNFPAGPHHHFPSSSEENNSQTGGGGLPPSSELHFLEFSDVVSLVAATAVDQVVTKRSHHSTTSKRDYNNNDDANNNNAPRGGGSSGGGIPHLVRSTACRFEVQDAFARGFSRLFVLMSATLVRASSEFSQELLNASCNSKHTLDTYDYMTDYVEKAQSCFDFRYSHFLPRSIETIDSYLNRIQELGALQGGPSKGKLEDVKGLLNVAPMMYHQSATHGGVMLSNSSSSNNALTTPTMTNNQVDSSSSNNPGDSNGNFEFTSSSNNNNNTYEKFSPFLKDDEFLVDKEIQDASEALRERLQAQAIALKEKAELERKQKEEQEEEERKLKEQAADQEDEEMGNVKPDKEDEDEDKNDEDSKNSNKTENDSPKQQQQEASSSISSPVITSTYNVASDPLRPQNLDVILQWCLKRGGRGNLLGFEKVMELYGGDEAESVKDDLINTCAFGAIEKRNTIMVMSHNNNTNNNRQHNLQRRSSMTQTTTTSMSMNPAIESLFASLQESFSESLFYGSFASSSPNDDEGSVTITTGGVRGLTYASSSNTITFTNRLQQPYVASLFSSSDGRREDFLTDPCLTDDPSTWPALLWNGTEYLKIQKRQNQVASENNNTLCIASTHFFA